MLLSFPVYLEIWPGEFGRTSYVAQPLFDRALQRRAPSLPRVLEQLRGAIGAHLRQLAENPDQRELSDWLSQPEEFQSHSLALRVADAGVRHFHLVSYRAFERLLVFVPRWPRLHFEVTEPALLAEIAGRVLTRWVRAAEQQLDMPELDDLALPAGARTRLSMIELDFEPPQGLSRKAAKPMAGLGGTPGAQRDGAAELRQVGRRLNDLYPHELDRALGREPELAELERLLQGREKSALLLLGPRKVGKSCLFHEWLWRHLHEASTRPGRPTEFWLLAPMRLISGMSYLGEWEERVLAILEYAERHGTVLVFDDLPGLFQAGISSGSDLSVGDLLLPWLEQRRVRVLAEASPEVWARLREQRRRFADQFQALSVSPPPVAQTWVILAALQRQLERQHALVFELDAVPTAHALCTRFVRDQAFPGNVAALLKRVAAQATPAPGESQARIDRGLVLQHFSRSSGIGLHLLDQQQALPRDQIRSRLERTLRGQPAAIDALSAALSRFKAGLNDPRRPLGVFLLVGPTGVGKTQCAKAVAGFLGAVHEAGIGPDQSNPALLRFDLNEFGSDSDAARLLGTPSQPEGLLTAAIRRQPCAVVLFDEIEKAAPAVYDLLLALLDEGRLTDALGRVADFTQAVILLTSNLGAREAQSELGFARERERGPVYQEAARKFFRPEFFNRLDEVIAFTPFNSAELERITRGLVEAVLQRSGMRERQCLLELEPAALQALLASAHDPLLGARALKRGVEKALAQPLARLLAAQVGRLPAVLRLRLVDGQLKLEGTALEVLPDRRPPEAVELSPASMGRALEALRAELDEWVIRIDALAPSERAIGLGAVDAPTRHYFALREQQRQLSERIEQLQQALVPRPGRGPVKLPQSRRFGLYRRERPSGLDPARWSQAVLGEHVESALAEVERELHWLKQLSTSPRETMPIRLTASTIGVAAHNLPQLWCELLQRLAESLPGLEFTRLHLDATGAQVQLDGVAAPWVARLETGCWLQHQASGALQILQVALAGTEPGGTVVRLLDARSLLDLRGGLEIELALKPNALRQWWLAGSQVAEEQAL